MQIVPNAVCWDVAYFAEASAALGKSDTEFYLFSLLVSASVVPLRQLSVWMALCSAHSVTLPSRSSSSWPTSSWRCTTHLFTMGYMSIHVGGKLLACASAPPAACRSSSGLLWPSAKKPELWRKWVSALEGWELLSYRLICSRFLMKNLWMCFSVSSVFWKRFDLSTPGGLTTPTSVREHRKDWDPKWLTLRTLLLSQTWTSLQWHGRLGAKRDGADGVLIKAQWRMAPYHKRRKTFEC